MRISFAWPMAGGFKVSLNSTDYATELALVRLEKSCRLKRKPIIRDHHVLAWGVLAKMELIELRHISV